MPKRYRYLIIDLINSNCKFTIMTEYFINMIFCYIPCQTTNMNANWFRWWWAFTFFHRFGSWTRTRRFGTRWSWSITLLTLSIAIIASTGFFFRFWSVFGFWSGLVTSLTFAAAAISTFITSVITIAAWRRWRWWWAWARGWRGWWSGAGTMRWWTAGRTFFFRKQRYSMEVHENKMEVRLC